MAKPGRSRTPKRPRSFVRRWTVRLIKLVAIVIALPVFATVAMRFIPPPTTAVILERRIDALVNHKAYRVERRWVPWSRISPSAPLAVIAAEDQNFAAHRGFDFDSIQKAIDAHEKGQRLRGASTISQQVAKNLFLWSGRSFVRKGLEAGFTVLIEATWPKRRILEVYLNIVELGDGVFGVEAASQRYFRKPASRLGPGEAALLAAVLPNPIRMHAGRPSAYVEERRGWILEQMGQMGGAGYIRRF